MATWKRGSELDPMTQHDCKLHFVHRWTGDHKPGWAHRGGQSCKMQFASDSDWLANTLFAVTKTGGLDLRVKHCQSSPTWPDAR